MAPPRLTTMWPISPAAPRPSHGLPSRISPPPTPVPQKTPSSDRVRLAGAELELRLGRHLDVVADPHLRCRAPSRASRRAGSCPPSRGCCWRRRRRRSSRRRRRGSRPRRPQLRGLDPGLLGGLAQRRGHLRGDVLRPALGRGRVRAPRRRPCPARRRSRSGSWCRRGRCRRAASLPGSRLHLSGPTPMRTCFSGARPYRRRSGKLAAMAGSGLEAVVAKRRWYERNRRPLRRWRINRHMARAGASSATRSRGRCWRRSTRGG